MRLYLLFFLFILFVAESFSQETAIKSLNIKSLDTSNVNINSFNLNRIKPIGLTNKVRKKYFNYNLDVDLNGSRKEIDITGKTNLVTPTLL